MFYAASSPEIIAGFQLESIQKPVIYMIADDGEGLLEYRGEILEMNLSQWVLKNSSPGVNELSIATANGKLISLWIIIAPKFSFVYMKY